MISDSWLPHRRDDGEIVGYLEFDGEGFAPRDLLGRAIGTPMDLLEAEDAVTRVGLAWLAEPMLAWVDGPDGEPRRVRVVEVTRGHVTLIDDDFGASAAVPSHGSRGATDATPRRVLELWTLPLPLEIRLASLGQEIT